MRVSDLLQREVWQTFPAPAEVVAPDTEVVARAA